MRLRQRAALVVLPALVLAVGMGTGTASAAANPEEANCVAVFVSENNVFLGRGTAGRFLGDLASSEKGIGQVIRTC